MKIASFDPGITTGYVFYDTEDRCIIAHRQFTDPLDVAREVHELRDVADVLVVEAFTGGGHRTTEAIDTLKLWGLVEYLGRALGMRVVVQQPQKRMPYRKRAREYLPTQRHASDALAHALAYESSILSPKASC